MIKRILLFLLAAVMVVLLAACGGNTDNGGSNSTNSPANSSTPSVGNTDTPKSDEWPDNEWTKQVLKPPFTVSAYSEYGNDAYITLTGMTYDATKAYVEQLKSSGFEDYGGSTDDGKELGFLGKNADGWKLTVTSTGSMIISKPE